MANSNGMISSSPSPLVASNEPGTGNFNIFPVTQKCQASDECEEIGECICEECGKHICYEHARQCDRCLHTVHTEEVTGYLDACICKCRRMCVCLPARIRLQPWQVRVHQSHQLF